MGSLVLKSMIVPEIVFKLSCALQFNADNKKKNRKSLLMEINTIVELACTWGNGHI